MDYVKYFEERGVVLETDADDWKLKNEKEVMKYKCGNCYDTSYCAWKHFKGSFRIWMTELESITNEEIENLKKGNIPPTLNIGATHCICVYVDTSWHGLHSSSYVWWEYSWKQHRGIHKYKSLDKLIDDIVLKWKKIKSPNCKKLLLTQITNTKLHCKLNEFIERGLLSKIIRIADI